MPSIGILVNIKFANLKFANLRCKFAEVAEQADAHDSKSCGETRESSILSFGTILSVGKQG